MKVLKEEKYYEANDEESSEDDAKKSSPTWDAKTYGPAVWERGELQYELD